MDKDAGQKCIHQRFKKGCAVYHTSAMPGCCALWNCRWLVNDDTADLARPDRSRYVIDIMPEFVTATDETGTTQRINVVQIWVSGDHWRHDKALRAYMQRRGAEGMAILVRFNSKDATTIFPPSLTGMDEWFEKGGQCGPQHTAAEVLFGETS